MIRHSVSVEERLGSLSKDKTKLLELLLDQRSGLLQEIQPYPRGDPTGRVRFPASGAQQRLWFIDQLEGGSTAYHIPVAVRLRGELNRAALQEALDKLIKRHESLRTVFINVDGEPMQEISMEARFSLESVDLRAHGTQESEHEVRRHSREELAVPFDLGAGPLIRGRLLQLSEDEYVLLVTMHHIISDGWSVGVLIRELGVLYGACREGRPDPLMPLSIQYADYAQWQRQRLSQRELQEQLKYWKEHLHGAPELLDLPTDRPRPAVQTYRGSRVRLLLGPELTADLKALSRRLNLTLAMALYTAWSIVLSRISGQEDIVVGMPVANRRRTELEELIGFFVNTLAVRVRLEDDPPVTDLLQRVKAVMLGAYAHQDSPFDQVVEAVRPARRLSHSPIFQVMFAFQNAPGGALHVPGVTSAQEEVPSETAKFDLILSLEESADGVFGSLSYASDLFDSATIERWIGHFKSVLSEMVKDLQQPVSELLLMSGDERQQVIVTFNSTQVDYPRDKVIHQLVEEQVERIPEAVAVVCGGQSLTYAELNGKANQLARYLRDKGVGPDQMVAVYLERSLEMVVGLLGILKAGGAYVPLDPNYPSDRLQQMLQDSAPRMVLTQENLRALLPATRIEVRALDSDWTEIAGQSMGNLDAQTMGLLSHHLAYVIYTSGSTGTPKGVMVEHRNATNLVHWHCDAFSLNDACRCSCVAALGFDAAAWEIWPSLSVGATLVLAAPEVSREVEAFLSWWASEPLDVSFLPTPMAELAVRRNIFNPKLRTLLVGGDRLRHRPISKSFSLINNYGPTESTVVATSGCIYDEDAVLHIGRPISNAQIYILDRHQQAVPIGIAGEIYIGGAGVARGYLNRPALTTERFVRDPFSTDSQACMYKTGDIARWRSDGTIEYLGRNDHQVKIRGFRIELGEIETQLVQHADVKEAVVIEREDIPGEHRLVAYVTSSKQDGLSIENLRTHLKTVLPEYMVPSALVVLESLPLTTNGKLDRRALPIPDLGAYARQEYEAPQGDIEKAVAEIWQELLQVERVGRKDNFFELGGHSLLATRVLPRIYERLRVELPLKALLDTPTVEQLSVRIKVDGGAQSEQEARLMDKLAQNLRLQISQMDDAAVLTRITELEAELGYAEGGLLTPVAMRSSRT